MSWSTMQTDIGSDMAVHFIDFILKSVSALFHLLYFTFWQSKEPIGACMCCHLSLTILFTPHSNWRPKYIYASISL